MVTDIVDAILNMFPDAHIHSGYARIRCPYHKDGKERKPSMSILLESRGELEAGFCNCFACGKKTNIKQLLQDIGSTTSIEIKQEHQQQRQQAISTEPPMWKVQTPFRYSKYLASRGISEDTQTKFKVYEKDDKVYMPVFNRDGILLYANARSTSGKAFYVQRGATKSLWGIEEIDLSKPIAVCESQIDAMSLWEIGIQAVATLGADNISSLAQIKDCTSRIVLAFDPDDAGRRARDRAMKMLGRWRCYYLDMPEGIDVNQALQDIKDKKKYKDFLRKCLKKL